MNYEAIEYLTQVSTWLLIITPFVAGTMVTYQAVRKSLTSDGDTMDKCNRLIRNTVKGAIIIMTISGFIEVVKSFYL